MGVSGIPSLGRKVSSKNDVNPVNPVNPELIYTSFPSSSSSLSPQEQSLQAFLLPVVPHTLYCFINQFI